MDSIIVSFSTGENLFVNSKSILMALLRLLTSTHNNENLSYLTSTFPAEAEQDCALLFCFSLMQRQPGNRVGDRPWSARS